MDEMPHVYDYNGFGCRKCIFPQDSPAHFTSTDIMYGGARNPQPSRRCGACGLYDDHMVECPKAAKADEPKSTRG